MSDNERSSKLTRREFNRLLGATALGFFSKALIDKVAHNESDKQFTNAELVNMAKQRIQGRPVSFGIHPDFEHPQVDPWKQMDGVKAGVEKEDYIGLFTTIEQLRNHDHRKALLYRSNRVVERGAQPVIGLGYGDTVAGFHPFDHRAAAQRKTDAKAVMGVLNSIDGPVTIRLFYEMNLSAFVYGRGRELSNRRHEEGYRHAFADFANHTYLCKQPVSLSFNPFAQNFFMTKPFARYWPVVNGQLLANSAGFDVYHVFPGKLQVTHPYYWYPGQFTPEDALLNSAQQMQELTAGLIPWYVWEIGSLTKDAGWLAHAWLLALAMGSDGLLHFNFNKKRHRVPHEGDWTIDDQVAAAYKWVHTQLVV